MPNVPIVTFNAGEFSPHIDARIDVAKYSSGCRDLENMIPRIYGSAERRPGTKYIATAKDSDSTIRMIPFQYSDDIAYMCEFGEEYIRYYYDGAVLVGSDSPDDWAASTDYIMGQFVTYSDVIYRCLIAHTSGATAPDSDFTNWVVADLTDDDEPICETPSPYQSDDLLELQYHQSADVMWIVHRSYQPRKLTRTSSTTFDLSIVTINNGPFKKRNDLANNDGLTLTPSAKTNYEMIGARNFAASKSGATASESSGSGTTSGVIGSINDSDDTTFWQRKGDGVPVYLTWEDATAYFTVVSTFNETVETLERVVYRIDWGSSAGYEAQTVRCQIKQDSTWTTIGTSTNSNVTINGSWSDVSAVRIYMYAKTSWCADAWVKVKVYELEAWGTRNEALLTASSDLFTSNHIGALFKITQPRENSSVSGSSIIEGYTWNPIDVKGEFTFRTTGTWYGSIELQRNVNGEGWETYRTVNSKTDARANADMVLTEEEDNVKYRMELTSYTSGTPNAEINVHNSIQDGICRVTSFISSTVVAVNVLSDFASTKESKRWYEGAWSNSEGWPGAFTFFEERSVYGGTTEQPQTIWLSESKDYDNFDEGTKDADSFWLTLSSDKRNGIIWLSSIEALCVGTTGGEWRVRATSLDEQLTPTNYNARQQTDYGSKKVQPLQVGDAILFVDSVGRKLREMTWRAENDKFVAPDLTALAEHITKGTTYNITSMANQKNPDHIVWLTLDNGTLLSMVYEREQNVVAWSSHPLGGTDAEVDSIAVIPGTSEDEIWMCVSRTINSSTVKHIELMQPRAEIILEDSWFVDDGLSWDGGAAKTITTISQADPCVITSAAHGLSNDQQVYIADVDAPTNLNGNYYTVKNKTTDTIQIVPYIAGT